MTAADPADVPSPVPAEVGAMLPALAPLLSAALPELADGECLVAGLRERVEALGLDPHRGRREVETSGGVLVAERAALGEVVAAAVLQGWTSAAVDLGRVVAHPRDGGGALCVFILAGGCWWTRVRPEAAPLPAGTRPAVRAPAGAVLVELPPDVAVAWLRLLGAWAAFGAPVNAGPVAELRAALERAMGVR